MIAEQDLVVRPATADDMPGACALLHELGLSWPSPEDADAQRNAIDRLWRQDPFFAMSGEPVFYGWVMLHEARIVGFFGSVPRAYLLDGAPISVSIASNWGVRKEYRAFTRLLSDAYFQHNPIDLKLVTTGIAPTGRIFDRYGGHRAPVPRLDQVYIVPFKPGRLAGLALPSMWRVALRPLQVLMDVVPLWRWGARRAPVALLQEHAEGRLPDDFQRFWEQIGAQAKGLVAVRDAANVSWVHGEGRARRRKRIFVLRSRGDGPIEAYASLVEEPIAQDAGFQRWKIGDLLSLSERDRTTMLTALIQLARRSGCHALEFHLPGSIAREDIPAFTFQRKVPAFPVHYHCASERTATALRDPANWPISPYDGDTLLG